METRTYKDEIICVKQAAAVLEVSEQEVYDLKRAGQLPWFRIGNVIRFFEGKVTAVAEQLAAQRSAQTA
jgi:predicted DNA-binding transcriptional regulator AlpA